MKKTDVIVVGAGPAGFMAALRAAELGAQVTLLEKMTQPGLKLGLTGKGRCNLSNTADLPDFIAHFGATGSFLHQAFYQFFTPELLDFFNQHQLAVTTERGGRIFPQSGRALEVRALFRRLLKQHGVVLRCNTPVAKLLHQGNVLQGVETGTGERLKAKAVILATGGASYPATGSTGDGYPLATSVGHQIIDVRPALVPLTLKHFPHPGLAGLMLRNVALTLFLGQKKTTSYFGELQFTEFGITGPLTLKTSGRAVDGLRAGQAVRVQLDLKPALDEKKLDTRLQRDFQQRAKEPLQHILGGLLPRPFIPLFLKQGQLDPHCRGGEIKAKMRQNIRQLLKAYPLTVTGYRPLKEAIVTAGGIDTREVDPRSMASRYLPTLFFAGELLDLQADTGGYNLQAAFSTGRLAGEKAAQVSQS